MRVETLGIVGVHYRKNHVHREGGEEKIFLERIDTMLEMKTPILSVRNVHMGNIQTKLQQSIGSRRTTMREKPTVPIFTRTVINVEVNVQIKRTPRIATCVVH